MNDIFTRFVLVVHWNGHGLEICAIGMYRGFDGIK